MQICNFLRLVCALKSASLLCMHVDLKDTKCLINNPPPYCIYIPSDGSGRYSQSRFLGFGYMKNYLI